MAQLDIARFQYFNNLFSTIAVSPAWTLLGVTQFPVRKLILASNSTSSFQFSIDGINPIFFLPNVAIAVVSAVEINLADVGLAISDNVQLFARRVLAGAAGNLQVTLIGAQ